MAAEATEGASGASDEMAHDLGTLLGFCMAMFFGAFMAGCVRSLCLHAHAHAPTYACTWAACA
jgi:hypothetical protein